MTTTATDDAAFSPADVRRAALLEAAEMVDALSSNLGDAEGGSGAEGQVLRDLAADQVGLAATPIVFRLAEEDFSARGLPIPVAYQEITRRHRLYWICAPVSLLPARHWGFNALDMHLEFNPDQQGARPVAFGILPDPKIETVADIGGSVEVSIDPSLNFSASTPDVDLKALGVPVSASAGVEVSGIANAHAALGPFRYRVTRAKVSHTPVGMEYVRWRIDEASSLEGAGPELVVLLAVPSDGDRVVIDAQMRASRYFRFATAPLLEKIRQLPGRLREYFLRDGAPVDDAVRWDITPML